MSNQIFKDVIPFSLLNDILEEVYYMKTDSYYILNFSSFKKANFKGIWDPFIEVIKPYYHKSKQYYVERKMNYNRFMTIIRQICKINGVSFVSNLKYDKSNYDIYYFIYFKK